MDAELDRHKAQSLVALTLCLGVLVASIALLIIQ
jgi:hypothetical protein